MARLGRLRVEEPTGMPPADEFVPLDTTGVAAFSGCVGAVVLRNGKPVRAYDLDSPRMSRHPIARLMRALTFWKDHAR